MQIQKWLNKCAKLNISDHIIKFIQLFSNEYILSAINNPIYNNALDAISNHLSIIISFDIEFQSYIISGKNDTSYKKYTNIRNDKYSDFIREFGMIIFAKSPTTNIWYFLGKIFVNFNKIGIDILYSKIILSSVSDVSPATLLKMQKNEKPFRLDVSHNKKIIDLLMDGKPIKTHNINKKLKQLSFEIYGIYLDKNKKYQNKIIKQSMLYYNDPIVKNRTLTPELENKFMILFGNLADITYFVVKGKRDLHAVCNHYKYIFHTNECVIDFNTVFDIEFFNRISYNFLGSAQLEATFDGLIQNNISYADFLHILTSDKYVLKAHNPITDSIWTLVIAMIIITVLNDYFKHNLSNNRGV
jgi:hypothetical protein